MLTGKFPFNFGTNIIQTAIVRKAKRPGALRIELDRKMGVFGLSGPCREFVLSLMVVESDGRTAASEALSLPWLRADHDRGWATRTKDTEGVDRALGRRQSQFLMVERMESLMSSVCEVRRTTPTLTLHRPAYPVDMSLPWASPCSRVVPLGRSFSLMFESLLQ